MKRNISPECIVPFGKSQKWAQMKSEVDKQSPKVTVNASYWLTITVPTIL